MSSLPPEVSALKQAPRPPLDPIWFDPQPLSSIDDPVPSMLIDSWLVETSVAAIYGKSDSYKSYIAGSMAQSVAYGIPFLDRYDVTQGAVLIIDSENHGAIVRERMDAYKEFHKLTHDAPLYVWFDDFDVTDDEHVKTLIQYLVSHDIKLLVLDLLADLAGSMSNENDTKDSTLVSKALRRIAREANTTVLFVHHTNDSGTWRGNKKLKGACDTRIKVVSESKDSFGTIYEVRQRMCINDRKEDRFEALEVDLGNRVNVVIRPLGQPTVSLSNDQRIIRAIDELSRYDTDPISTKSIVEQSGVPQATVYRRLPLLREQGVLDEDNRRVGNDPLPELEGAA